MPSLTLWFLNGAIKFVGSEWSPDNMKKLADGQNTILLIGRYVWITRKEWKRETRAGKQTTCKYLIMDCEQSATQSH